jgi:hypothetical protein
LKDLHCVSLWKPAAPEKPKRRPLAYVEHRDATVPIGHQIDRWNWGTADHTGEA